MSGPLGSQQWMYASGGFYDHEIDGSLQFDGESNTYLSRTVTHNRKTFTISFWLKRSKTDRRIIYGAYNNSQNTSVIGFEDNGTFAYYDYISGYRIELRPSRVFRDESAWYHIVVAVDTTQATASNRVKIYINGEQETSFSTATYPSQNLDLIFGSGITHAIGTEGTNVRLPYSGEMANFALIAGQQLDATSFGEFKSGVWIPKNITGLTYGTGGYLLEFAGNANDTSGNVNNWTTTNVGSWDYVTDSPTNNFNTGLTIDTEGPGNVIEGGRRSYITSPGNYFSVGTSMAVKGGKWYYESRRIRGGNNSSSLPEDKLLPDGRYCNSGSNPTGSISINVGSQDGSDGVYMTALDLDNGYVYRGRNGSWSNGASAAGISSGSGTGAVKTLTSTEIDQYLRLCVVHRHDTGTSNCLWNFGQDSTLENYTTAGGNSDENGYGVFKYSVPTNFLAMCSANLPQGAINTTADETPEDYFNTVLWTGDNTNNRSITGVGFQPSLVSAKSRSANSGFNWVDAVRGGTKTLQSNNQNAEITANTVISFDSDGFTVGDGNGFDINKSGEPIVGWSWKANGAGVSNTDGSITSTVSVGATSQQNWFSIVKYTGTGVNDSYGHGLGVAPNMIITKDMTDPANWAVYVSDIGTGKYLQLNSTAGTVTNSVIYPSVSSTTIGVGVQGDGSITNTSGDNYISYCFANAEGLCKVGSYTGNGSTDGSFIFTGFRPAFVMWKRTDTTSDWFMMDVKRDIDNPTDHKLEANTSGSEVVNTAYYTDYLSNGFKLRNTNAQLNASGGNYIYLAIAEQPFKYANAR